jgi:hypothetical protein
MNTAKILLAIVCAAFAMGCANVQRETDFVSSPPREAGVMITSVSFGRVTVKNEHRVFQTDGIGGCAEIKGRAAREWQDNYAVFSQALTDAAKKARLDSASLAEILRMLRTAKENKYLAVLPVAAHSTTFKGEPAWVIGFRWEGESWVSKSPKVGLSHVRHFIVSQKTLKQLGFNTCG